MFKKCLINQVIKLGKKKKMPLEVIQRYLSIYYNIKVSKRSLIKRYMILIISSII